MKTIKRITVVLGLLALSCVVIQGFMYSQETTGQIFERALYLEESQGDLKGAISLYETIVKDDNAERAVAAKAQLHIGLCSEKLGVQNAQKEYQAVIDNYPEFEKEVTVAKNRLSQLAGELKDVPSKPTFTKIQVSADLGITALSPDGNKVIVHSTSGLWVAPTHGKVNPDIVGESVLLPGTEGLSFAQSLWLVNWSGDGKWVSYLCPENNTMGICVVPSSGGKVKRIANNIAEGMNDDLRPPGEIHDFRLSLSPDGKALVYGSLKKGGMQLFTVPVEGGNANQLTEAWSSQPAFSPDGKKIAYVKYKSIKSGNLQSNVWVIPATGGTPVQVSDLPGWAVWPTWSPDGTMIAFLRKQTEDNKPRICIVPVSETGTPESSPTQIEIPHGTMHFLSGWPSDNRIGILLTNIGHSAIYTVPATGGPATQVSPQGGLTGTHHPRWSPDGERLYFRWTEEQQFGIATVPSEGGKISYVYQLPLPPPPDFPYVATPGGGVGISPDGERIVFSGAKSFKRDNKTVHEIDIYTIPVQGGEPTKLTEGPDDDRFPFWSPDGKSVAFVRTTERRLKEENKDGFLMNICIVPTEGGKVRQLTSESHQVIFSSIAWSPDGKWIAYFSKDGAIRMIRVQGGESREVVKVEGVLHGSEMAWSQDSKKIAYTSEGAIWQISIDGGKPERIETGLAPNVYHVSWSPDGEKIAFCAVINPNTELFFMEDFLPLD
jgi:Tol biopolymer transport system component